MAFGPVRAAIGKTHPVLARTAGARIRDILVSTSATNTTQGLDSGKRMSAW